MTRSSFRSTAGWPAFLPVGTVYLRGLVLAALAGLVALIGAQTPAWAHPTTITLSASYGHPGVTVKVSGAGFDSYEAVDIYFDSTDETLATTGSAGTFSNIAVTAPTTALPGAHYITGIGRHSGRAAQAELDIYTDWAQYKLDRRRKSYNAYENVVGTNNVASLDVDWTYQTGIPNDAFYAPVVVVDGTVYGISDLGQVFALNGTTGSALWTNYAGTAAGNYGGVAVSGGDVFACFNTAGVLEALSASTGSMVWTAAVDGCAGNPAVANGTVYADDGLGNVLAIDASTGIQIWGTSIGGGLASTSPSPAVGNGLVFATAIYTTNNATLYALNASTGATVWSEPLDNASFTGTPAVAGGVVYIGDSRSDVWAFAADSGGTEVWGKNLGSGCGAVSGTAVAPDPSHGTLVYAATQYCGAVALSAGGIGNQIWSANVGSVGALQSTSPAVANGLVYFSSYLGGSHSSLYALDASSGTIDWSAVAGDLYDSDPVLTNGMLYFGSDDGNLYAYALNGGNDRAYKMHRSAPKIASLHPDYSLKPQAGTP